MWFTGPFSWSRWLSLPRCSVCLEFVGLGCLVLGACGSRWGYFGCRRLRVRRDLLLLPLSRCLPQGWRLVVMDYDFTFPEVHGHRRVDVFKRPGPRKGSRGMATAYGGRRRPCLAVFQTLSLVPCTVTASGAAGHNRGRVAETPQSRTADCIFTSLHHVLLQDGFIIVSFLRLAPGTRTSVVSGAHDGLLPQHAQSKVPCRHADWT